MIKFENELASSAIGISMKRIGHDDIEPMSSSSHKAFTIKEGSHLSMTPGQVSLANDYTSITLGDTIKVSSNDSLTLSADNEMNIGQTVTEYIDSSGALAVSLKETKNIRIKATELLSMVVLSKGTGLEMDEETVFNSLGQTNLVGSDKVAYSTIVVNNDMSALDDVQEEEAMVETEAKEEKGGFWNNFGKIAAIAVATVAVVAVAIVAAPVVATAIVGAAASTAVATVTTGVIAGAAMGCAASVGMTAAMDVMDDGEINRDASEYFKAAVKGTITGGLAGGIGAGVSGLHVVARIGIEAGSDFAMDIAEQLTSNGFKLSEIKWGQAAFYAGLGIVIGESAGYLGKKFFKGSKEAAEEVLEETIEVASKSGRGEIIDSRRIVDTNGLRNELPLTENQISELTDYTKKLGFPEENIVICGIDNSNNTGLLFGQRLYINNDVLPTQIKTMNPNSLISGKATIAHEVVGHYETVLKNTAFETQYFDADGILKYNMENLALDEAQASLRAARFAPDLSRGERIMLIRDGLNRLRNQGIKLKDVKHLLDIFER